MQDIIREGFKDATVISIAHRLHTLLDFDRVIVIDKGVVVEDGNPQALLEIDSAFRALYELGVVESKEEHEEEVDKE